MTELRVPETAESKIWQKGHAWDWESGVCSLLTSATLCRSITIILLFVCLLTRLANSAPFQKGVVFSLLCSFFFLFFSYRHVHISHLMPCHWRSLSSMLIQWAKISVLFLRYSNSPESQNWFQKQNYWFIAHKKKWLQLFPPGKNSEVSQLFQSLSVFKELWCMPSWLA